MVLANLTTGRTRRFDLRSDEQYRELRSLVDRGEVAGLSLSFRGTLHALPLPKRRALRREVSYRVELLKSKDDPVGEQIALVHNRAELAATVYASYAENGPPVVRTDLRRTIG